jgi:hypothetical protein
VDKIKTNGSVKVTVIDGQLSTSRVEIEGWLAIDYNKYLSGVNLLECLILDGEGLVTNFPTPV